ncbi:MAG: DUF3014 domain-containing protein [Deltaproteobacteria bacterium]|nr:DUF3014 domain-containing protein [Deltaproteobacteria bacterium]NCP04582.1 DUF3014 domain-containing protein [Deltaproteobacteria bacterium]
MNLKITLLLLLVITALAAVGWYFYLNDSPPLATSSPEIARVPTATPTQEGSASSLVRLPVPPRNPVPPPVVVYQDVAAPPAAPPFPQSLNEADAFVKNRVVDLVDNKALLRVLVLEHFIPKLVLFVDQLPRATIARRHLPLVPPSRNFMTQGSGDERLIDSRNAERYRVYVELLEAVPDKVLLHLYRGLYPLFQLAYYDISPDNQYFNDRFIEVISHLLETPEPQEPIRLVRHISRFRYADPQLEARSAGQKILLRMGVENSRRVKAKLASLRAGLVRKD